MVQGYLEDALAFLYIRRGGLHEAEFKAFHRKLGETSFR